MLRLMVRLMRGGGVAGGLRLVLMVCGVAVGVAAATLVAVLPAVLDARAAMVASRLPAPAGDADAARFRFVEFTEVWGDRRLGRVFIADVHSSAPAPPGVAHLPAPGQIVASPALARKLRDDISLSKLVPGTVVDTIDAPGLLGPDELFAYIGVRPDEVGDLHSALRWGSRDDLALQRQQQGLTEGLALLVLPTAIVYLVVCSRLAAATRARRYAALRLLGLRRGKTLRLAAGESAAAGGLGALAGIIGFTLAHPALAASGLLGFRWYPTAAEFTPARAAFVVLTVVLLSAALGAVGLRRALARPVQGRAEVGDPRIHPSWLALLALGLGMIAYPLLMVPPDPEREVRLAMSDVMGWLVILGVALSVVGMLVGLRPLVVGLGAVLNRDWLPTAVRLAGRRMVCEPASALRMLAGVGLLLLVAGVGQGVMRDLALRAGPTVVNYEVQLVGLPDQDPRSLRGVFDVEAAHRWTIQRSVASSPPPGPSPGNPAERIEQFGIDLVSVECEQLREVVSAALPTCADGRLYRLVRPDILGSSLDTPAGTQVRFRTADGTERRLAVPAEALVVPAASLLANAAGASLVFTGRTPYLGWTPETRLGFLVSGTPGALAEFKAAAAGISPAIRLYVPAENIDLLEIYYNQRGVLSSGVFVGFILGVLAFLIAALDRVFERRRDVAALRVLGMRVREIRMVQIVQLAAPLVLVLLASAAVGHLAGNAVLRLNDVHRPWYLGTLTAMAPLAGVAVVAVLAAGVVVASRRMRAEDLRRE